MKRIQYDKYGGPELMRLEDFDLATPGKGEVAVTVKFAAINPIDWKVRNGYLKMVTGKVFPRAMGSDFSGTVISVGPGVTRFKSGDAVFGIAFLSSDGEGAYSDVFYDSVKKLHEEWPTRTPILLGHVIAHEIGHLLLGTNAHSWMGIMRSQWQGEELQSIAMGKLLFTPPQIESLKARLSASPR